MLIERLNEKLNTVANEKSSTTSAVLCRDLLVDAIDYIYDHLHQPLKMEQLAEVEGLHPSYFSKLFAAEVGTTVKAYIINVKITTAQNMLRQSEHTISDIAYSLGFSSQSAFTATFKNVTGETPAAFRNKKDYVRVG